MAPDPTHPRTWAAVRDAAFALEAAAYRHGGTSSADVLGVEWTEAGDLVRAHRAAFLRALADLEYEVRATMPRRPVPAEPSYARRTVDPALCRHTLVAEGSDYLSCPDCGTSVTAGDDALFPATASHPDACQCLACVHPTTRRSTCSHPVEHVARAVLRPGQWYCHQCGTCCSLDDLIG